MAIITHEKLKKLLVGPGHVDKDRFALAVHEAKEKNKPLEAVLVEKQLVSDEHLGKLIASESGYRYINLRKETISEDIIRIVPEVIARTQHIIVFDRILAKKGEWDSRPVLKVAMVNPDNYKMVTWLKKKTGDRIEVYYTTRANTLDALKFYHKNIEEGFAEIVEGQAKEAKKASATAEDVPIIRLVDTLVKHAYENGASDIHVEPLENETMVRFRIDGILHNAAILPKKIHDSIVSRIKVLSKLRTDEHFAAQDGKFQVKVDMTAGQGRKERFDIRVSIVPITEGEKVVMRILSERLRRFTLEAIGLLKNDLKKVRKAIKATRGMILVTGPTGCGKTTTLYTILKILNKTEVNITTIEDPVEYDIEGVNQIQIKPKTGLTFAKGLRSIVRQDPDIIMVGEIRDEDTASIAINSAMTGHLVLSTMHANTAATNLVRLNDMGIEPFLVASSVNIIIAQRLVRKICERCVESYELKRNELEELNVDKRTIDKIFKGKNKIRFYLGKGCKVCNKTGYTVRTSIFETLEIEENIRKMIMRKASADEIEDRAVENGMTTMFDDGLRKAMLGITTIEEVLRVVGE